MRLGWVSTGTGGGMGEGVAVGVSVGDDNDSAGPAGVVGGAMLRQSVLPYYHYRQLCGRRFDDAGRSLVLAFPQAVLIVDRRESVRATRERYDDEKPEVAGIKPMIELRDKQTPIYHLR